MQADCKTDITRMIDECLASLQTDFVAALFDASKVGTIEPAWSGAERLAARFAVHRENIFATWEKSLGIGFPVIRALVGAEFFALLAREYARTFPSTCSNLNCFGENFAKFLCMSDRTQSLPYLADIGDLEWAVNRAYFAADIISLSPARLAALSPRELLSTRFALHPACAWMLSRYPIATIWLAHQSHRSASFPDTLDQHEHALVYRSNWRAGVVRSSKGEVAALAQLRDGEDSAAAIVAALIAEPEFEFAQALVRWVRFGLFAEPARTRET
jgi:uncharacterized protein